MKLMTFQIMNFRSINDSGLVSVANLTSLVGRNESGKSNLLLGLLTLNPPGGPKDLNGIKDFPRHRRLSEWSYRWILVTEGVRRQRLELSA
jgi:recombinational DNA repair ATPase RecF